MSDSDRVFFDNLRKTVINVGVSVIASMLIAIVGFYFTTKVQIKYISRDLNEKADKAIVDIKFKNIEEIIKLNHPGS